MNRQNGKTTTSLSSKALKVQIKRSHSSPTHDPFNFPAAIIPSQSEIPKKATVTVSPESTSLSLVIQNKKNSISAQYNNKRRINSKLADLTHSLRPSISSSITQDRSTSLRMSASSRFGKNLLPAWLGGHQSTGMLEPSFSDTTSNYSTSIDSSELDTTFERLLDELNMRDGHRDKLRQLPRERKLYLLQQNQHIKDNKPAEPTRKSLPTSTSTTSIFTPKGLRPKAIKRSETTRLLFASKRNNSSNTLSTTSNHSLNSLSSEDTVDIIPRSGSSRSNRLSISEVRPSQKKNQKKETLHTYDRSLPASSSSSSYSIQKHRQIVSPSPSVQKIPESLSSTSLSNQSNVSIKNNNGKEPVTPIPTTSTATLATTSTTATTNTANTSLSSQLTTDAASEVADLPEVTISPSPEVAEAVTNEPQPSPTTVPASSSTAPPIDRRAATYKYARRNLRSSQNQSKVGSMILEFDALAHKHGDPKTDESAAWLLLDNKTLPRQTGGGSSGGASHTNVNHIFPKQSDSTSTVSSSVTNSYAYQSLTRKEGSNLASMAVSEEVKKPGRDRNSPYYYVERLRSRNVTIDALTKHLISLRITLATGSLSWTNEFLSRRHGGLAALESVSEKLIVKKKKKGTQKLTENEENCLYECIKCIRILINTKPGLQQVLMRPVVLHHLIIALFASLATIYSCYYPQPTLSLSSSVFRKSPSITSIGSQLISSRTSTSNNASSASTCSKISALIFEIFTALCLSSQAGYDVILKMISEVKGEQYRFERLVQALQDLGIITKPDNLLLYDCAASALAFFNAIVQTPRVIEKRNSLRTELERRGLEAFLKKLEQEKNNVPDSLEHQVVLYFQSKKQDQEQVKEVENTKRQSILQLQPDDMVASALKSFYSDPEVYYLVVDSISELVTIGKQHTKTNKQFVLDIWGIIHLFAKSLKSMNTSNDFKQGLQQFLVSIQPIVGKINSSDAGTDEQDDEANDVSSLELLSNNNNFEDVEGLRNLVEELKENMKRNQEVTAKIRREKNELLMKVSKAMADIKERDDQLDAIQKQSQLDKGSHHDQQGQQQQLNQMDQETQGKLSIVTANMNDTPPSSSLSPPPPPPPPPPPLPPLPLSSQPTMMDQYKQNNDDSEQDIPLPPVIRRRNLVRRNSAHRASKYLHPLAINLCFPNLKSLHESTANASSPTTNDVLPFKDPVKKNVSPTMKQFFWSKLPVDKIENTVWKEISSVKTSHSVISDLSSITSSDTEDSVEAEDLLDTVELERLFKKKSSTKQQNQEEKNEPMRRQITLLEFNRANNIAIMLAKIRLPYPDIRDAIWNIDDNMLTVDNLMSIRQYIPTKEEIELVKEYQGDVELLGNAERYFRAIMYIPRLGDRVNCMIFRRRFKTELEEILPGLDTIQLAITELRESSKFKYVLKTILIIGNHLNNQTIRGNAYGFHLNALLKMRDTRAEGDGVGNVPTLLHYLVYLLSKSEDDAINFKQDIAHLQMAAKLSPPTIFANVNSLGGSLTQIKDELAIYKRRKTSDSQIDRFGESMEEFLLEAEPIVSDLKKMTKEIEDKLKEIIVYYGEDPTVIKSEEFFDIISSFSNSFEKAQFEIHEARERALRRQRQQEMQKMRESMESPIKSPRIEADYRRPTEEGFEQVLRELKAGLRQSNQSWRTKKRVLVKT